jgi:hypothetical protein
MEENSIPEPEFEVIFEALSLIYAYIVSETKQERKKFYKHFKEGMNKRFKKIVEERKKDPNTPEELWPTVFDD